MSSITDQITEKQIDEVDYSIIPTPTAADINRITKTLTAESMKPDDPKPEIVTPSFLEEMQPKKKIDRSTPPSEVKQEDKKNATKTDEGTGICSGNGIRLYATLS